MQKVRHTRRKWWRNEALYLSLAAGAIVFAVLLSVGIHACLGRESTGKVDGMGDGPNGSVLSLRATRVYQGSLILCDSSHPFDEDAVEALLQDCVPLTLFSLGALDTPLYALASPSICLQSEAAISLSRLASALAAQGHAPRLLIEMGYLAYDGIGESPFHTGYDITLSFLIEDDEGVHTIPLSKAGDTPETRAAALWLLANRARYGWIAGTSENSLRYVGHPHASYIESHQLTLEAYLALLRAYTSAQPLIYTIYGTTYTLYYKRADHGAAIFTIPNAPFSLSGDGDKGFIICYVSGTLS